MSLFEKSEAKNLRTAQPLAARCVRRRSRNSSASSISSAKANCCGGCCKADRLGSVIFYGPPGTGKTTLARLLATETRSRFRQLSAVTSGVKELRDVLEEARNELAAGGQRTLLFIDEIHRFNRAQQDALLPDVEEGVVTLVGATTANPFFAVNSALVSRSQIFQFQPLSLDDIKHVCCARALTDASAAWARHAVRLHDDAWSSWPRSATAMRGGRSPPWKIGVLRVDRAPGRVHRAAGRGVGATQGHALRSPRATRTTTRPVP